MSQFIRIAVMAVVIFLVIRLIRYFFRTQGGSAPQGRDTGREVKNASFKSEDVQDARFKDVN